MHVAIYGNLIHDTILTISKFQKGESHICKTTQRGGGILNVARALQGKTNITLISSIGSNDNTLQPELSKYNQKIYKSKTQTSSAYIISDLHDSTRTSFVNWGACKEYKNWQPILADWHHIAYLDGVNIDISTIQQMKGIISADLIDSTKYDNYLDYYKHIDYLFLSDTGKIINNLAKKATIEHSPDCIKVNASTYELNHKTQKISNLNVLGAGDYFAANTIANILLDKSLDLKLIHEETVLALQEFN